MLCKLCFGAVLKGECWKRSPVFWSKLPLFCVVSPFLCNLINAHEAWVHPNNICIEEQPVCRQTTSSWAHWGVWDALAVPPSMLVTDESRDSPCLVLIPEGSRRLSNLGLILRLCKSFACWCWRVLNDFLWNTHFYCLLGCRLSFQKTLMGTTLLTL